MWRMRGENPLQRVVDAAVGAFSDFFTRDLAVAGTRLRRAVQVHRRAVGRDDGAVRHRARLLAQRIRGDHQGRRACRDAARRLCRRLCGARLSAGDEPVDRRHPAGGRPIWRFPGRRCVGHDAAGSPSPSSLENFTSAIGTVDLRRLPVGAVPQSAAHRDPIRVADRARRGRPHLSVVGAGFLAASHRLGLVLRDLCAGRVASRLACWLGCNGGAISTD